MKESLADLLDVPDVVIVCQVLTDNVMDLLPALLLLFILFLYARDLVLLELFVLDKIANEGWLDVVRICHVALADATYEHKLQDLF